VASGRRQPGISRRQARAGAQRSRSDRLEALADELGGQARSCAGDISDPELSERLVKKALSRFGRLDVAINNAGIVHDHDVSAKDASRWKRARSSMSI
jgi:NADP-dependent 3-hydroxy acid dehydrogenase YdfG